MLKTFEKNTKRCVSEGRSVRTWNGKGKEWDANGACARALEQRRQARVAAEGAAAELGAGESVGRGLGGSVGMASQQAHSSPPPQPRAS